MPIECLVRRSAPTIATELAPRDVWHDRRGVTAHCSVAQIVEIREALELITDERNRQQIAGDGHSGEKSPKSPQGRKNNGLGPDHLTRCLWMATGTRHVGPALNG
jgi:hypothetical protein